jgi:hypothetical protein
MTLAVPDSRLPASDSVAMPNADVGHEPVHVPTIAKIRSTHYVVLERVLLAAWPVVAESGK